MSFHYFALMPFYKDQLGRSVEVKQTPQRMISVVPSQTELLSDLGLDEEVIGITKFCVHPEKWFRTKTRIGGTKQLHLDRIRELQPDFILANKEENVKEQIEELAKEFPVWISDVNNLQDALGMMTSIGKIMDRQSEAETLTTKIQAGFSQLPAPGYKPQACYLIWKDPYMTIGGDTFIHQMLNHCGLENCFADRTRYPELPIEALKTAGCQLLLLSSEPYPFKQKHVEELQTLLPQTKILLVDSEMFSWYGSRLVKAPAYFRQLQREILALSLF